MPLKPTPGYCVECQADAWIVKRLSTGDLCHKHNRERLKARKGNKPRKPLRSKRRPTGELSLFMALWASRPHISFVSGAKIASFDIRCMFHVLGKGAYGKYRLYDRNIIFTTAQEHRDWHSLGRDQLLKKDKGWQKVFDLYDELKAQYNRDY